MGSWMAGQTGDRRQSMGDGERGRRRCMAWAFVTGDYRWSLALLSHLAEILAVERPTAGQFGPACAGVLMQY